MGGFWSAVVMAEVDLPSPLTPGVIKGLLLRHLRHWASKHDAFYSDGTLNIGYGYPNMYMSEDYNSPQSPYWCMKTFSFLSLPHSHHFWQLPEEPLPFFSEKDLHVTLVKEPQQIVIDSGNHHFLLNGGQYCAWPLKATEAKYSKFAYSSTFGFSVPTGSLIQQTAPDSTLALSVDGGETWRVRWKSEDTSFGEARFMSGGEEVERVPVLKNAWRLGKHGGVKVETTLVPSLKRWKDWHLRIHKIQAQSNDLLAIEGGFAIYGRKRQDGLALLPMTKGMTEGTEVLESGALVLSSQGASGILCLGETVKGKGEILKPDANTNLMVSRTLIPTIKREFSGGATENIFITAVFAVGGEMSIDEVRKRWEDVPKVCIGDGQIDGDYILI
jgi:hypothetical protein